MTTQFKADLEHVNLTVTDPNATAGWMETVFGWRIRWQGPIDRGAYAVHVGTDQRYIALFSVQDSPTQAAPRYRTPGAMNHLAVVVPDLEATEDAIRSVGFAPHHHAEYAPGRRLYFIDDQNIEYEVVSYAP